MKSLLKLAALAALFAVASTANAAGVADTKHNLAGTGTSGDDNGQMCVYCHAPHTDSTDTSPPLWNHTATVALYTMYTSGTMNMILAANTPGTESLVCLSCHDGTVALDSILNTPEDGWAASPSTSMDSGAAGYMGTNLKSEHPIGVTYDVSLDTDFDSITDAQTDKIVFFGGSTNQVECASCHAVHDYSNVPFLRLSNDDSALCLACHNK
jgi:predicted CXXCH cytochrome family protein